MRVVVITPPEPVVTTDEAKRHLKQDSDDDAQLIASYVAAATAHIDGPDGWLGRCIGVQTLEARVDVFCDAMALPYPPLVDIVAVKYLDDTGTEITLLPAFYETRGTLIGSAFGKRWPSVAVHPESVRIQYRAGYAPRTVGETTISTVPESIKAAILLMAGDLYRNRSTANDKIAQAVPMSITVKNLLDPFRIFR
ncbi:head-tail connector protein [Sphingomonas sp. PB2P12]|uniref:head-tail connector protein n=1 Tax=Sphingomonas sandaracina TaxID=3096157 RepID=UPI002FC9FDCD